MSQHDGGPAPQTPGASAHEEIAGQLPGHEAGLHGVLVVDKPRGPTSHDVVGRVRRTLGTKRVGHAGTLDPMATGVLIVLVGEATKLTPFLTAETKRYEARVRLGEATTTLDAEGELTERAEVAEELLAELDVLARSTEATEATASGPESAPRVAAALAEERARTSQIPPIFSAIHVDGARSHELARKGTAVELPPREVRVHELVVRRGSREDRTLDLELSVSKGYYVRSLARDLGARLGVPAHLVALRRTASGAFDLARSAPLEDRARLVAALITIPRAIADCLPCATLTDQGVVLARQGKRLAPSDFDAPPPPAGAAAWLSPAGSLVAVGEPSDETFRVVRGFTSA